MKLLAASDFHLPHADKAAVRGLCYALRDVDALVLNGDILDGEDLGVERKALAEFGSRLRDSFAGEAHVILGNHDLGFFPVVGGYNGLKDLFSEGLGEIRFHRKSLISHGWHFTHGSLHSKHYASDTMDRLGVAETAFVVGHTHRPQVHTYGNGQVYGLPCMSLRGVPGASLGWGVCSSSVLAGRRIRRFELTTFQR